MIAVKASGRTGPLAWAMLAAAVAVLAAGLAESVLAHSWVFGAAVAVYGTAAAAFAACSRGIARSQDHISVALNDREAALDRRAAALDRRDAALTDQEDVIGQLMALGQPTQVVDAWITDTGQAGALQYTTYDEPPADRGTHCHALLAPPTAADLVAGRIRWCANPPTHTERLHVSAASTGDGGWLVPLCDGPHTFPEAAP